jgi:hypothetical protein
MRFPGGTASRRTGTRFRVFPQSPALEAYRNPETVWISGEPGTIGPGPSDDRMYVIDALDKRPYEYPYLPPYTGPARPPVISDAAGHFDYLPVDDPGFRAAHMYATVRRVLDIWESYFDQRITWHFSRQFPRLELVPYVEWENAHSGFGFLETGYEPDEQGRRELHCLNFDVLAHELGHQIIYAVVGTPPPGAETVEYFGFHESAADVTALIAVLCFNLVADHVLRQTAGNIYNLSELSRIGEISQTTQIRIADNTLKMSDVADPATPARLLCQPARHSLAQPLTGAIFDVLVDIYQRTLWKRGLISAALDRASGRVSGETVDDPAIGAMFAAAYEGRHEAFRLALQDTGDYLGTALAWTWRRLSPEYLSYEDVLEQLLWADAFLTGGEYRDTIVECFVWREIGVATAGRGGRRSVAGRGARQSRVIARR